ncbi:hypothetical protein [Aeromonas veronii]|uniref:hypothetical protein n=1 Tax=Aeromonas veronii TaxID=654 RepID=UPI0033111187|nr:hypothetical protein [Aeromonas veronii]HDO1319331.1 hypothetical protein [Aeromonas veronii]
MMKTIAIASIFFAMTAHAGVINPDCNAEKVVKGAAMNAAIGVNGRCSASEAVKDTVTDNTQLDEKVNDINDKKNDLLSKDKKEILKKEDK